jgi:uncharacterized surface protein with fasciclin (FAS1) repeats
MKKLSKFMLVAFIAILGSSCNDDTKETLVDNTITGIATKNANLSILVQALGKAELASTLQGSGPFTVFAPTNDAFNDFLEANGFSSLNDVPKETLKQILLNHVVSGKVLSTQLTTGYIKTLATYGTTTNTIDMYVNTSTAVGTKLFNGVANVVTANVDASNGVVHVVDAVIGIPTIATHVAANPNFSALVTVVSNPAQSTIFDALSGTEPLTVFAPTNSGFTKLNNDLIGLGVQGGLAGVSQETISNVLLYHALSGNKLAANLTSTNYTTLLGQTFEVQLTGGAKIKDKNNRLSNIILTDIQCSNGVIHAIDNAILPAL